jgi:hypothetical protein
MSHEPPIPDAARSPYPLQKPPAATLDTASARSDRSHTGLGADEPDEALLNGHGDSLVDRARETFDRVKQSRYGLGAAIGIGSAALLAAVLYARYASKDDRPTTRAEPRPRRTVRAKPGKTGSSKPAAREAVT